MEASSSCHISEAVAGDWRNGMVPARLLGESVREEAQRTLQAECDETVISTLRRQAVELHALGELDLARIPPPLKCIWGGTILYIPMSAL